MKVDVKWAWKDISFENCFSLNPKTYESTGLPMNFVVKPDGEIWPNPITEGKYRNCTEMPAGEPIDGYERRLAILRKYTDKPEEAHHKIFVEPFQF